MPKLESGVSYFDFLRSLISDGSEGGGWLRQGRSNLCPVFQFSVRLCARDLRSFGFGPTIVENFPIYGRGCVRQRI